MQLIRGKWSIHFILTLCWKQGYIVALFIYSYIFTNWLAAYILSAPTYLMLNTVCVNSQWQMGSALVCISNAWSSRVWLLGSSWHKICGTPYAFSLPGEPVLNFEWKTLEIAFSLILCNSIYVRWTLSTQRTLFMLPLRRLKQALLQWNPKVNQATCIASWLTYIASWLTREFWVMEQEEILQVLLYQVENLKKYTVTKLLDTKQSPCCNVLEW